jgi:hypothetical protein
MALQDILIDAGAGFVGGFAIGLSGITDKRMEELEFFDALSTKEEVERAGVTEKHREATQRFTRDMRYIYPLFSGIFQGSVVHALYGGDLLQHTLSAVCGALAGRAAGTFVRKMARRNYVCDLEATGDIRRHPENALNYLPRERRDIVEAGLSEFERRIVNGEELKDINKEVENPDSLFARIYGAIWQEKKKFTRAALLKWSLKKYGEVGENALMQRALIGFHDSAPLCSSAVIGNVEKTKIKMYEFSGGELITYSARFEHLRLVEDEKAHIGFAEIGAPVIEGEKREKWDGDYRRLASDVLTSQNEYTTMFLKAPPGGTPDITRRFVITTTFIPGFREHQKARRIEQVGSN